MAVKKGTGRKMAPKPKTTRKRVAPRRDPAMKVRKVDGLPPQHRSSTARVLRYQTAMAEVRKMGKGVWAVIAEYDSPNGAAAVRRAIIAGERPIDGRLAEWEIETRRTRDGDGVLTGSELYVRLK